MSDAKETQRTRQPIAVDPDYLIRDNQFWYCSQKHGDCDFADDICDQPTITIRIADLGTLTLTHSKVGRDGRATRSFTLPDEAGRWWQQNNGNRVRVELLAVGQEPKPAFVGKTETGKPITEPIDALPIDAIPRGYSETYRGHVPAWHCDGVEHFTIAYYFERLERATARFLSDHGIALSAAQPPRHRSFFVRYARELRVSSVFVMQTGIIEHNGARMHLGHRIVDAADGAVCTTIEHTLEGTALTGIADRSRIDWDGPARAERQVPGDDAAWVRTGTDIVMPGELDASGGLQLSGNIHRFSASGGHLMTQFGWNAAYEEEHRVGFSTFELQMEITDPPALGTAIDVEACVAKMGRSSVHIVHRLVDAASRQPLSTLHQLGVHLDKDARRPSAIPAFIKAAATGISTSAVCP
ncbi:MAG: hypothetical protein GKR94_19690 [Gammaproteobacteria bacterium]|nr:hypothetical protein [Gammaproteobacteria bacterium]